MAETAVNFYDALAPLFDVMTDWDARLAAEGPFLQHMLSQAHAASVLDVACGSGGHALALARWGYRAGGIDPSPVMIDLAQRKAAATGLPVTFAVAGLADGSLARLQADGALWQPCDAIVCLGNSLPHLLSQEALVAALREMAAALRPSGLLILQNLNYDLRWRRQPRFFAAQGGELEGQEVLIWRFADYDTAAGQIAFNIALFRRDAGRDWPVQVHTTLQRPLFRDDLVAALSAAGFNQIQTFGKLTLPVEPFNPELSPDLIVTARHI